MFELVAFMIFLGAFTAATMMFKVLDHRRVALVTCLAQSCVLTMLSFEVTNSCVHQSGSKPNTLFGG